jgi:hypothetical protein
MKADGTPTTKATKKEETCLSEPRGVENEGANPGRIACTLLFWSTAEKRVGWAVLLAAFFLHSLLTKAQGYRIVNDDPL